MSERRIQPLYLLADSQLLFWKTTKGPFLASICETLSGEDPNVAYIGASNGDSPEAYAILTAALEQVQHGSVHMVSAAFTPEDRQALEAADVVVLAGGDVDHLQPRDLGSSGEFVLAVRGGRSSAHFTSGTREGAQ